MKRAKKRWVLITGGAGFVGSHLCDHFIQRRYSVICLDNLVTGNKKNIAHLINLPDFKFVPHDISKPVEFKETIEAVLHFASPASPPDYLKYPIQTMKVGSLGTHNALGIAKKHRARFIIASTSEVYGDPLESPQKESYWGHVNPVGPRGVYDEAKRFSEALTLAYHREHGLDTKIVRIFNTYGERMRPEDGRVIPNFMIQALTNKPLTVYGSGEQTRSYCYFRDLVRGIDALLFSREHQPVNLGNPNEMTVMELAKKIIRLTGSKSKIIYRDLPQDDPKRRCPDISRAKQVLGWEPEYDLETGLKATLGYFRTLVHKKKRAK